MIILDKLPEEAELFFQLNSQHSFTTDKLVGIYKRPMADFVLRIGAAGPFIYEDYEYIGIYYYDLLDEFTVVTKKEFNINSGDYIIEIDAISLPHIDKTPFREKNDALKLHTIYPDKWHVIHGSIIFNITKSSDNKYHIIFDIYKQAMTKNGFDERMQQFCRDNFVSKVEYVNGNEYNAIY